MTEKNVAEAVDRLFSADFLFDAYHSAWRQKVSPKEGTSEYEVLLSTAAAQAAAAAPSTRQAEAAHKAAAALRPPSLPIEAVAAHVAVAEAGAPAEGTDLAALVKRALALTKHCVAGEAPNTVRRVQFLNDSEDPIHRTVRIRPIHHDATDTEIRDFVEWWLQKAGVDTKSLLSVAKKNFTDVSGNGVARSVFFATAVFADTNAAKALVAAGVTYTATSTIAQRYLPPVRAELETAFQERFAQIEADRMAQRARQAVIRGAAADDGTMAVTEQYLTPGRTLKVSGMPPGVSWRDVKVKLSNLFPEERRLIRVVHEHDGDAFVVLFATEKVEPILAAWAASRACHAVIPNLTKIAGEEEKWAIQQYPAWINGTVTKKVQKNQRFVAKRLRDD